MKNRGYRGDFGGDRADFADPGENGCPSSGIPWLLSPQVHK